MTVKEFDKYIRMGLGRCFTELSTSDRKEKYRAAVLRACLHNYSYDAQSEGSRAEYIYSLAAQYGDDGYFVAPVVSAFMRKSCRDGWDFWDFVHYCRLLFEFAKRGSVAAKTALCEKYDHLLERLAVKRKRYWRVDTDAEQYERLCIALAELDGRAAFDKIKTDLDKLYRLNTAYTVDDFDAFYALLNDESSGWGGKARAEEAVVLSRRPTAEELELSEKFKATADEDERHCMGMDIINAFEHGADLPCELLDAVYYSRCGCCRFDAVKLMAACGQLTDERARECVYDSYGDTREFAKNLLESRKDK